MARLGINLRDRPKFASGLHSLAIHKCRPSSTRTSAAARMTLQGLPCMLILGLCGILALASSAHAFVPASFLNLGRGSTVSYAADRFGRAISVNCQPPSSRYASISICQKRPSICQRDLPSIKIYAVHTQLAEWKSKALTARCWQLRAAGCRGGGRGAGRKRGRGREEIKESKSTRCAAKDGATQRGLDSLPIHALACARARTQSEKVQPLAYKRTHFQAHSCDIRTIRIKQ